MKYKIYENDKNIFTMYSDNLNIGDKVQYKNIVYKIIDRVLVWGPDYNGGYCNLTVEKIGQEKINPPKKIKIVYDDADRYIILAMGKMGKNGMSINLEHLRDMLPSYDQNIRIFIEE